MQASQSVREMANSEEFKTAMTQIIKRYSYLEDYLSEAIVKAFEKEKFTDNFEKFLKYIVWKAFKLRVDSLRRKTKFENVNIEVIEIASDCEDIVDQAIHKEELEKIRTAVRGLSQLDQLILKYRYEDGNSFREISEKVYHKPKSQKEAAKLIKRIQNQLKRAQGRLLFRDSA